MQWLRDQLGIIATHPRVEALAAEVDDAGGVYFVPAFSGLFAPYWRSDARGAIVGLSRFHTAAHLARATLEAICYQSRDVVEAMAARLRHRPDVLKVDGGVTAERAVHADPGRHARRRGDQAEGRRDHRPRGRVRRRPRRRLLGLAGRLRRQLARGPALDADRSTTSSARPGTPAGTRPSNGPLTGPRTEEPRCTPPPPRSVRTRAREALRRLAERATRRAGDRCRGDRRRLRPGRRHPGPAGGPGRGAGLRGRHLEPFQQAVPRRPALSGAAELLPGLRGTQGTLAGADEAGPASGQAGSLPVPADQTGNRSGVRGPRHRRLRRHGCGPRRTAPSSASRPAQDAGDRSRRPTGSSCAARSTSTKVWSTTPGTP